MLVSLNFYESISKFFICGFKVNVDVVRCERVADALIVEFSLRNKRRDELLLSLSTNNIECRDDLGNSYRFNTEYVFEAQGFTSSERTINVSPSATVVGKFRVSKFDSSNSASSITISPKVNISGMQLDVKTYDFFGRINDSRPKTNGVQSCDKNLEFNVSACERVGGVLVLDFSITNKSNLAITDFFLNTYGVNCSDDLGNSYWYSTYCAFTGQEFVAGKKHVGIGIGETVYGRIRVEKLGEKKISTISISPECSSQDYVLEEKHVNFVNIAVTDRRVVARGINSCDRNIDFKFVGFSRDGDYGVVSFTVTNKTSSAIEDFTMDTYGVFCKDDLQNSYSYKTQCAFEKQDYSNKSSVRLGAGKTVSGKIRIKGFAEKASYVSINPKITSSDYILDSEVAYFLQLTTR